MSKEKQVGEIVFVAAGLIKLANHLLDLAKPYEPSNAELDAARRKAKEALARLEAAVGKVV